MLSNEDLFFLAESHFNLIRNGGDCPCDPEYFTFPLPVLLQNFKVLVIVKQGKIRELELSYDDGSVLTLTTDDSPPG